MENNKEAKSPAKRFVPIIGAVVAITISLWLVFKKPSFDTQMEKATAEINKSCPVMLDEETRLDNASADPKKNIILFNYTLVHLSLDSIDTNLAIKEIQPKILEGVKTNEDLKPYKDHNTTLAYNYKDKAGKRLFRIDITPAMYKK